MLNDLQLQQLKDSIQNSDLSRDEISRLVGELEQSYRTLLTFDAKEQSYVTEIQRLNSVVMQLMEYVETIAEIAGDTTPGFSASEEIKRRAVELIINSVGQIKDHETR